jgi:hypothetical protein
MTGNYADASTILANTNFCYKIDYGWNHLDKKYNAISLRDDIYFYEGQAIQFAAKAVAARTPADQQKYIRESNKYLSNLMLVAGFTVSKGAIGNFNAFMLDIRDATWVSVPHVKEVAAVIKYQIYYTIERNNQINNIYNAAEFASGKGDTLMNKAFGLISSVKPSVPGMSVYTRALKESKKVAVAVLSSGTSELFIANLNNVHA